MAEISPDAVAADFVDGLIAEAFEPIVREMQQLNEPFDEQRAGTFEGERLRAQIEWFNSLDTDGKAKLEEIVRGAVRSALFEACVFLDSGHCSLPSAENEYHRFTLSLETRVRDEESAGELIHSQPMNLHGPDLHDELMAAFIARDPNWQRELEEEAARMQSPQLRALSDQAMQNLYSQMRAPQSEEEFTAKMQALAEQMRLARIEEWNKR